MVLGETGADKLLVFAFGDVVDFGNIALEGV